MPHEPVEINRYLYEQIYSELKGEILSGKYRKGDWFPPERVLKDRFKTTHLTVRNALAKLVLEGYIERYSGKGTLVIYSRERAVVPKTVLRFSCAHVIMSQLDEANARILELLEAGLRTIPLQCRFSAHGGDPALELGLHQEAVRKEELVILQPVAGHSTITEGHPGGSTILVRNEGFALPAARVLIDDAWGARKAVRYLLDLGHRTIGLCAARARAGEDDIRAGYVEELSARGVTEDGDLVETAGPGGDGGRAAVRRLLGHRAECRAFFCASDEIAAGAIRGLREAGLAPGADCSVIGYGNVPVSEAMGLTTVDPGFDRLAECVITLAREAMSRGTLTQDVFRIPPELRIRESCTGVR
jgi:DNA-binding transcriptional regulator YhcF (GntR family)